MVVVLAMLLVGLVVVMVVVGLGLRTWTLDRARKDAWLLSPDTHTVSYVVAAGQDPAVLLAAVAGAGYPAMIDTTHGTARVVVACDEHARGEVRAALEHVHRMGFDGSEMLVEHVAFDDE